MKIKSYTRKTRNVLNVSINLPGASYPWKVLGWVADDLSEYLTDDEYFLVKQIVRDRDIFALGLLSEDWGLLNMHPDCSELLANKARYIIAALLKKYRFPGDDNVRKERALNKFLESEASCKTFNEIGYLHLIAPKDSATPELFTYAREFLRKLLGERLPGHQCMTEWSRHGPGANLDTYDSLVSNFHKFDNWPYSCTIDAYRYSRFSIESDQRWFGALQDDYRERFNISRHLPLNMEVFWSRVLRIVDGNRITFVPKNSQIDRSIAIEAALNLYLQLGCDGFIRRRLKRYKIDLDDQSKNQCLARQGSFADTSKSFVTIDLSAASDSISTKLVELLLPPEWYRYLMDIRSPFGQIGESSLEYEKISSMGNGFTFALESAIFASAIFAVQKFRNKKYEPDKCAVFGDDLIVEKDIADQVIQLLSLFGFAINTEKSFLFGPVRESCGTDWFHGAPVRPIFFSDPPTTVNELFTDINRLKRILELRCGLEESKTISLMEKWVPIEFKNFIGPYSDEDFDSYLHSAVSNGRYKKCVWEYKRLIVKPRPMVVKKFLIQKLMHNLRPLKPPTQRWEKRERRVGSRFGVTRRNVCDTSFAYSVADIWRTKYTD